MLPPVIAPDGSPVELYALLPDRGEGDVVASALPPGASVLELGCGAGRMTRQLVALGFRVTAVDESAEMLAHVRGAATVRSRIEELELGCRFDAVLLASNLFNTDAEQRRAFLRTCRRHAGVLVVEALPLAWEPAAGDALRIDGMEGGIVHGEAFYEIDGRSWSHRFAMRVFADEAELQAALGEERFRLERWLDGGVRWFVATAAPARP